MSPGLRYHPCLEQRAVAEMFADSLHGLLPLESVHARHCEDAALWAELEGIGLFGIGREEAAGGAGLGAAEEALIAMELGRGLVSPSVLATIGAAHARPRAGSAPLVDVRVAAGWWRKAGVTLVHDAHASLLLLRGEDTASVHELPALRDAIDTELWHADLLASQAPGNEVARLDAAGLTRLRLNDAAALAGIAALALEQAVAYAGERRQFGRPIGSFQAIKHHCANMAIAARNARDQVGFASVAVDQARPDAGFQVDCALLVAADAALDNASTNIQVHGGIGFSEEALPHLLLKRARLLLATAGGREPTLARIAGARAA
ncbi:acyl-CoA dehydrogenase family protein [Luteimonas sp. SDU101]|uniref:acyl-CoA dehydrogenase family protein n=1 Tax=unclassified Luteimonas TaxID=2629088 RepID=UPI003EB75881